MKRVLWTVAAVLIVFVQIALMLVAWRLGQTDADIWVKAVAGFFVIGIWYGTFEWLRDSAPTPRAAVVICYASLPVLYGGGRSP